MLSVQLSIIKLVFRNPCVVKARFCPLDIMLPDRNNENVKIAIPSNSTKSIIRILHQKSDN